MNEKRMAAPTKAASNPRESTGVWCSGSEPKGPFIWGAGCKTHMQKQQWALRTAPEGTITKKHTSCYLLKSGLHCWTNYQLKLQLMRISFLNCFYLIVSSADHFFDKSTNSSVYKISAYCEECPLETSTDRGDIFKGLVLSDPQSKNQR